MEKQNSVQVLNWLEEHLRKESADRWLWMCTAYPFRFLSEEELKEGLSLAVGDLCLDSVVKKHDDEMWESFNEFKNKEES